MIEKLNAYFLAPTKSELLMFTLLEYWTIAMFIFFLLDVAYGNSIPAVITYINFSAALCMRVHFDDFIESIRVCRTFDLYDRGLISIA